jgi:hypothetical protein
MNIIEPSINTMPEKHGYFSKFWGKMPERVKNPLIRFYSNKKIFWPVAISIGLVFLLIIIGLIFGSINRMNSPATKTPIPTATPVPTEKPSDILTITQVELGRLRDQILQLDVKQNRLKPPTVNYDIKF